MRTIAKALLLATGCISLYCGESSVNPTPPAAPTGVTAVAASPSAITVAWTAVAGATEYVLYRDGSTVPLVTTTALSYTDTGLAPNSPHTYQVASANAQRASELSAAVSATTQQVCPGNNGCARLAIVYPNGGEVLHVGDTCKIKIHADTAMELILRLYVQGGLYDLSVGQTREMRVPRDSIFNFVVSDSSTTTDLSMVSAISDSCLIHAYWYNNSWCYDESDCFFAIRP